MATYVGDEWIAWLVTYVDVVAVEANALRPRRDGDRYAVVEAVTSRRLPSASVSGTLLTPSGSSPAIPRGAGGNARCRNVRGRGIAADEQSVVDDLNRTSASPASCVGLEDLARKHADPGVIVGDPHGCARRGRRRALAGSASLRPVGSSSGLPGSSPCAGARKGPKYSPSSRPPGPPPLSGSLPPPTTNALNAAAAAAAAAAATVTRRRRHHTSV